MLHGFVIMMGVDPQMGDPASAKLQRGSEYSAADAGNTVDHTVGCIAAPASFNVRIGRIVADEEHKVPADPAVPCHCIEAAQADIQFQQLPLRISADPPYIDFSKGI